MQEKEGSAHTYSSDFDNNLGLWWLSPVIILGISSSMQRHREGRSLELNTPQIQAVLIHTKAGLRSVKRSLL